MISAISIDVNNTPFKQKIIINYYNIFNKYEIKMSFADNAILLFYNFSCLLSRKFYTYIVHTVIIKSQSITEISIKPVIIVATAGIFFRRASRHGCIT